MDGMLFDRRPGRYCQQIDVKREVVRSMVATAVFFGMLMLLAIGIAESIATGGAGASGTIRSAMAATESSEGQQ